MNMMKKAFIVFFVLLMPIIPCSMCFAAEGAEYKVILKGTVDGGMPGNCRFDFSVSCYVIDESGEDNEPVSTENISFNTSEKTQYEYKLDNAKVVLGGYYYVFKLVGLSDFSVVPDNRTVSVYLNVYEQEQVIRVIDSSVDGEKEYDNIANGFSSSYTFNAVTAKGITVEAVTDSFVTKVYDGKVDATLSDDNFKLKGVEAGDEVKLSFTKAEYNSTEVKAADKVTVTGLSLVGADASKYKVVNEKLELKGKIEPRPITVTADNMVMTVGSAEPELKYTLSEELIAGNNAIGALARTSGAEVGEYVITRGTLSFGDNYEITFVDGKLTISNFTLSEVSDATTKIKVSGYFNAGATLTVRPLILSDAEYSTLSENAKGKQIVAAYDLKLGITASDGAMTVTFPISSEYEGKQFVVYQLLPTGAVTSYKTAAVSGAVSVSVDECTQFMLVTDKENSDKNKTPIGWLILKIILIIIGIVVGLALIIFLFVCGMIFFNKVDELKAIIRFLKRLFKRR